MGQNLNINKEESVAKPSTPSPIRGVSQIIFKKNSPKKSKKYPPLCKSTCKELDRETRKNDMIIRITGITKQQHVRADSPSAKWQQTIMMMAMTPTVPS